MTLLQQIQHSVKEEFSEIYEACHVEHAWLEEDDIFTAPALGPNASGSEAAAKLSGSRALPGEAIACTRADLPPTTEDI